MQVNRGEVWLVRLNPVIGHEQAGTRPALVVSNDLFNHSLAEMVIVLPVTSKYRGIPSHVKLVGDFLEVTSYIKTEDVRAISIKRMVRRLGNVDAITMQEVAEKLRYLLGLY